MIRIHLDGQEMTDKKIAHEYIRNKFNFPNYYGANLDGLWDMLTSYSRPLEIEIANKKILIKNLGSYGQDIIDVFKDASIENPNIHCL